MGVVGPGRPDCRRGEGPVGAPDSVAGSAPWYRGSPVRVSREGEDTSRRGAERIPGRAVRRSTGSTRRCCTDRSNLFVSSSGTLDALAAELVQEVERAAAARAQAGLVAEFDGMRTDVEAVIAPISEAAAVFDSSHLALTAEQKAEVLERQRWLAAQLEKVHA